MLEDGELLPLEVPETIYLPCGGRASFCFEAGYGYRCEYCMAVVGSVGMPGRCKDADDKYSVLLPSLGSKVKWNYERGEETLDKKAK